MAKCRIREFSPGCFPVGQCDCKTLGCRRKCFEENSLPQDPGLKTRRRRFMQMGADRSPGLDYAQLFTFGRCVVFWNIYWVSLTAFCSTIRIAPLIGTPLSRSAEMQQVLVSTLTSLGAAELLLILVRTREIVIIAKAPNQRTANEQVEIDRGLTRSVILEAFLFVPVSVLLVCLTVRAALADIGFFKVLQAAHQVTFDAMIGSISYGFPFAVIRRIVTTIALQTLQNFAEISVKHDETKSSGTSSGARSGGAES